MKEQDPMKTIRLPSDQDATGRTLGIEELECLREAIESGTLTSTKGSQVKALEQRFGDLLGGVRAYGCASGTAAIHTAIAALDLEPGDEIVTSAVTDMGALTPILYQGAIPVFADVDPRTCNLTAATIEDRLSERTRAVIVTHLFGNPCEMEAIEMLAKRRGLAVIEDCAQAFLATSGGRLVGTIGELGCFSLQQGKHITTGEGGLVVSGDEALARRCFLFINKAWGYGDERPDHLFLALNYRLSELQGAVAVAQLEKLEAGVRQRVAMAERLTEKLQGLEGVETPWVASGNEHVYWRYCVRVDPERIPGGSTRLGELLRERGIASAPRYIQKPAFRCQVIRDQRTFGKSRWPFTLARPEALDYDDVRFPGTLEGLERVLVLPWNERYNEAHVDFVADSLQAAVREAQRGGAS
jgi:dTDP-4-amino-4,6-dideoxygalactose transaminase